MPFTSKEQWRYCFYLQDIGQNGNWDCEKWAHETPGGYHKLPEYVNNTFDGYPSARGRRRSPIRRSPSTRRRSPIRRSPARRF
jgi:hypothetical protein